MKYTLLILLIFAVSTSAFAQFNANAPDCYYPTVGSSGEVDTIYGGYSGQKLGADIFNPGIVNGEQSQSIFIKGLPQNPPFLTSVSIAPPFTVKNMQIKSKTSFSRAKIIEEKGHFRDSKHVDLIAVNATDREDPRIYWSDDEGGFDSNRFTLLKVPQRGKGWITGYSNINAGFPCHGHFTSDTVSDVILGIYYYNDSLNINEDYIAFFRGGSELYVKGDTSYADSLHLLHGNGLDVGRYMIVGNFNGDKTESIIGYTSRVNSVGGDWFYYRNDSSFSLQALANSLVYDTLFTPWENPKVKKAHGGKALQIFPKDQSDNSTDLLCGFETYEPAGGSSYFFYKGGKDFGSRRLYFDSVDYRFHSIRGYDSHYFGWYIESLYPVGDMTGTGNPVLHTFAANGNGQTFEFYYVMGKALDDKVDMMYESSPYGAGPFDTLDANGDGRTDVLEGMPMYVTQSDLWKGEEDVGSLHLVYGSNRIPVKLNGIFAEEERDQLKTTQMYAYPNPLDQKTTLTFENCTSGVMYMDVVNSIGVSVIREELPDVDGLQQYAADLSGLPAGAYHIRLVCPADGWSASTSVIKNGGAVAPWKLDLKKMTGR